MWRPAIVVPEESNGTEVPPPITLQLRPVIDLTPDQLLVFSAINDDLHFELTAEGELIVMAPGSGVDGQRSVALSFQLLKWAQHNGSGRAFNHTIGYILKGNAVRAPSASWVSEARWERLGPGDRDVFPSLCPDFLVELRRPSHNLGVLQEKMQEYLDNDLQLGWLIDPVHRRVYAYRPGEPVQIVVHPETISADPLLPGFMLDLREIW